MGIAFSIFWVLAGLAYAGVKIGKEARESSRSNALTGLALFAIMMGGYIVIAIVGLAIAEVTNETVRNILFVVYGIAVVAVMAYFIIKPEIDMCRIANITPYNVRTSHPEIWEEVLNMPLPSDKVLKECEPEISKKFNRSPEELRRLAILRWRERKLEQIYWDRYVKDKM
jgi:hypothetical protein